MFLVCSALYKYGATGAAHSQDITPKQQHQHHNINTMADHVAHWGQLAAQWEGDGDPHVCKFVRQCSRIPASPMPFYRLSFLTHHPSIILGLPSPHFQVVFSLQPSCRRQNVSRARGASSQTAPNRARSRVKDKRICHAPHSHPSHRSHPSTVVRGFS